MKKSIKTNLNLQGYKNFVGSALWTVFRCWKVDQWAYNIQNQRGDFLWEQVKKGLPFNYSDEQIEINCTKEKGRYSVMMLSRVKFREGLREVAIKEQRLGNNISSILELIESEGLLHEKSFKGSKLIKLVVYNNEPSLLSVL